MEVRHPRGLFEGLSPSSADEDRRAKLRD